MELVKDGAGSVLGVGGGKHGDAVLGQLARQSSAAVVVFESRDARRDITGLDEMGVCFVQYLRRLALKCQLYKNESCYLTEVQLGRRHQPSCDTCLRLQERRSSAEGGQDRA